MTDERDTNEIERLDEQLHRGRRLGTLAIALIAAALIAVLGAAWSVGQQIDQNNVDTGQDRRIVKVERTSADDPCPQISEAIRAGQMERAANLIEACRQFLAGLANDDIFPHRLACFIDRETGDVGPNCRRLGPGERGGGDRRQSGSPSPGQQPGPPSHGGSPGNQGGPAPPAPAPDDLIPDLDLPPVPDLPDLPGNSEGLLPPTSQACEHAQGNPHC